MVELSGKRNQIIKIEMAERSLVGGSKKLKSLKGHSENGHDECELSEKMILQGVRKILDEIEVHRREYGGQKPQIFSSYKTRVIAGRMPVEVINQINRMKGSKTFHLERALRLYVKAMKETV